MKSITTTRVEEVMVTKILTVDQFMKMADLIKLFEENDINAAPVVDKAGRCVGIITSHDVVHYESRRPEFSKAFSQNTIGGVKNLTPHRALGAIEFPGLNFDEVGFHMRKILFTATIDDPLSEAARNMCKKHIHHVVVLNDGGKPIGLLSSLDVIGLVIGEKVCRSSICPVPD
jgi:CBS domain-containing protein